MSGRDEPLVAQNGCTTKLLAPRRFQLDDEWQLTPISNYTAHDAATAAAAVHQQAASAARNARHLRPDEDEEMILNKSSRI